MSWMNKKFGSVTGSFDWILLAAIIPIMLAGLVTMHSFDAENGFFFKAINFDWYFCCGIFSY